MKGFTFTLLLLFMVIASAPLHAQLYLRGTFNGWNTVHYLTSKGDSIWATASVYMGAGAQELKIANSDWSLAYGDGTGNLTGAVVPNPVGNRNFTVDTAGFYDFFFDESALTYTLTRTPFTSTNTLMYARGSFNGWGTDYRMALIGNHSWKTSPIALNVSAYEMKFSNHPDWQGIDWGGSNGDAGTATVTTGGGPNILFLIASDGAYEITFNDSTLDYSIALAVTSGIDHGAVSQNTIRVFPNPAQNFIHISNSDQSTGLNPEIVVLDLTGKVWSRQEMISVGLGSEVSLSVAELPAGIYLLRMGMLPSVRFCKE